MNNFFKPKQFVMALLCLTLITNDNYGQSQCYNNPPLTIFTDPDNYQNPDDPNALLKWDWRQQYWFGYRKGTPTPVYYQINSPFYDIYNPNLFDLSSVSVKNYEPKNGWELLKKDFGSSTIAPPNPYFILYNKYTGLVRFFVQINSNFQNTKSAMLTLRFKETFKTAGTLGQLGDKSFGLNAFKNTAKLLVPNQYLNGGQGSNNFFWLYADYNTMYDPCICKQTSMLLIESFLFSSWNVTLETNGKAETIISSDPNALTQVKNTDAAFSFGDLQNVTNGLSKGITQGTDAAGKLFTYGDKYVTTFNKLFPKKKVQDPDKKNIFQLLNTGLGEFSKVAELLGLPSFLSGFINSLNGGTKEPASMQFAHTDINLKTTGTLQQQTQFDAIPFRNAGSDKGNLTNELSPVYNNKLGVFNILELPKIEYTVYDPLTKAKSTPLQTIFDPNGSVPIHANTGIVSSSVTNCLNNACGNYITCPQPKGGACNYYVPYKRANLALPIYHYKVVSPLKFVINPASNLKLVSIKTSLVFQVGKNNYPTGEGQFTPTKGKITSQGTPGSITANNSEAWDELNAVGFSTDIEKTKIESELRLNKLGFDLLSKRYETNIDSSFVATQMIPATCIENTSFLIANGFLGGEKKVSLRVSLIFEPLVPVAGSTVDKILQTYTFDYNDGSITKITPSTPINYTDKVGYGYITQNGFIEYVSSSNAQRLTSTDISYNFVKGFMQVPTQLNFVGNGQCIPIGNQNLFVLGDINIDGQLCFTTTPITFFTMGNVNLLNGSILPPNVTVVKGVDNPCGSLTPTQSDPTVFCNSTEYNNLSQSYRVNGGINPLDTLNNQPNTYINKIKISPNPASNNFTVSFDILKKTTIKIDVFNSLSQEQPSTSLKGDVHFDKGSYSFKLSSDMLSNGIYFVRITAGDNIVTKKLIIQK